MHLHTTNYTLHDRHTAAHYHYSPHLITTHYTLHSHTHTLHITHYTLHDRHTAAQYAHRPIFHIRAQLDRYTYWHWRWVLSTSSVLDTPTDTEGEWALFTQYTLRSCWVELSRAITWLMTFRVQTRGHIVVVIAFCLWELSFSNISVSYNIRYLWRRFRHVWDLGSSHVWANASGSGSTNSVLVQY